MNKLQKDIDLLTRSIEERWMGDDGPDTTHACRLCKEYDDDDDDYYSRFGSSSCKNCPIQGYTGQPGCEGTPWYNETARARRAVAPFNDRLRKALTRDMRKYLLGLKARLEAEVRRRKAVERQTIDTCTPKRR